MREIAKTFCTLEGRNEGALIAYVTGGDPKPDCTARIVGSLIDGGVDIIELGIPFSDPIADGPTIQAAIMRSLKAGTTPRAVLEVAKEIKEDRRVPVVILTYYNPIFRMGMERFFRLAKNCKVDGVVVPDLPIEEAHDYKLIAETHEIDTIFLAAPSTSTERLQRILDFASGFLYLVSNFGVTGVRERVQDMTVRLVKSALPHTSGRIPLAVGFGISKPEHVRAIMKSGADGAIVGSAFVKIIEEGQNGERQMLRKLEDKARELKSATL